MWDPVDQACQSVPTTFHLENAAVSPTIEIKQVQALTHCDPARPNAVLEVSIPEDVDYKQNYIFGWFIGDDTSDSTRLISSGYRVSNISDTTSYTIHVTERSSACVSELSTRIEARPVYPSLPQVTLKRNRTDCAYPNGVAEIIITEGVAEDYDFAWFAEDNVSDTLFHTSRVDSLDVGTYVAYITSKETGCSSLHPASVDVFDVIEEKRFKIETRPSLCTEGTGYRDHCTHRPYVYSRGGMDAHRR